MHELTLPKQGKTMEEGLITEWTVEETEQVTKGEVVVLFETDKTTAEIKAEQDGVLLEKLVETGETVPVGTTLGYIGSEEEVEQSPETDTSKKAELTDVTDHPSNPESNKHTATIESSDGEQPEAAVRASPSARRNARQHDIDIQSVGKELGKKVLRGEDIGEYIKNKNNSQEDDTIRASPAASRLAEENDVRVAEVGKRLEQSRVRMADVESFVEQTQESKTNDATSTGTKEATSASGRDSTSDGDCTIDESIQVTGARKTMAERMQRVASKYASTTTVAKVDVTALIELRNSISDPWESLYEISPSLTAFVIKAAAGMLHDYTILNAEIVEDDGTPTEVNQFENINIGFAVNSDRGLLVPTIYDADERTVRNLSSEIDRLAKAAQNRELDFEDQQNATFTVSNAGTLGAYMNTPQITPPQTAVLGICAVAEEPGVVDGDIKPRKFMHLCLSYDHRVVEGATAVQFLQSIKRRLEEPASLLS